jgi:hypothetical protein
VAESTDQWNVPGSVKFRPEIPLDNVLHATTDYLLRGYWLEYDRDGQLVFVSNQNNADELHFETDPDGVDVIVYTENTTEYVQETDFAFKIERYS